MQRKGSKVLLCFRQWGHVSEDLRERKHTATLCLENTSVLTTQTSKIKFPSPSNSVWQERGRLNLKWAILSNEHAVPRRTPLIWMWERKDEWCNRREYERQKVWGRDRWWVASGRGKPPGVITAMNGNSRSSFHLVASHSSKLAWYYYVILRKKVGSFAKHLNARDIADAVTVILRSEHFLIR